MAMELKHLDPQHVMDVTGKAIDEISRLRAENAELKQKLSEKESWVKMLGEGEKALSLELEKTKRKLEDAKATAYAESVDAGMENRRLKRALWLSRAELCCRLDVDRYLRKHINSWYNENCLTWAEACVAMEVKMCKAESKCRAKAEEYK